MKILKKAEIVRLKQVDHVQSEFAVLRAIQHPFLVNLHAYAHDSRHLYFVMELVQGGELFLYLRSLGKLETMHAQLYAAQVVLMFEYLHAKEIVYRDLKPENLLINRDGYLKLTDFGFAKVVEGRTYTLCGTPEYLAPEVLLSKGHGKPVDWWTLGILTYEMLAGRDPFSDSEPMKLYQRILRGRVRFPRNFDRAARSLIKHLLQADLAKRFGNLKNGVQDIKSHRWFAGLDWVRLAQREVPMPYVPVVTSPGDASHFQEYPDSKTLADVVPASMDPFNNW